MADGKFEKGRQKTGGRKKGIPNKVTGETRELIKKFVESRWDDFLAAYDAIEDPSKKCYIMADILPFVSPKLANIEYKDKDKPKSLADELDEISGETTRQ